MTGSPLHFGGHMPVVQLDWQLRYPYAANPDGYYYWTNTYFLDVSDPYDFPAYVPLVETPMWQGMLESCQVNRLLVRMPPHSDFVLENAYAFNHPGYRADYETILENVARVHFFIGDRYASYKLLRAAVGTNEYEPDGTLNPTTRANLQLYYADGLIANGITDDEGTPFTSAVVSPKLHHWQLRHGTKRRQRVVIAPP